MHEGSFYEKFLERELALRSVQFQNPGLAKFLLVCLKDLGLGNIKVPAGQVRIVTRDYARKPLEMRLSDRLAFLAAN